MNSRFITQSKQTEIWLDMDILPSSVNSMKANRRTEFGSPHMRQSTTFREHIQDYPQPSETSLSIFLSGLILLSPEVPKKASRRP